MCICLSARKTRLQQQVRLMLSSRVHMSFQHNRNSTHRVRRDGVSCILSFGRGKACHEDKVVSGEMASIVVRGLSNCVGAHRSMNNVFDSEVIKPPECLTPVPVVECLSNIC